MGYNIKKEDFNGKVNKNKSITTKTDHRELKIMHSEWDSITENIRKLYELKGINIKSTIITIAITTVLNFLVNFFRGNSDWIMIIIVAITIIIYFIISGLTNFLDKIDSSEGKHYIKELKNIIDRINNR